MKTPPGHLQRALIGWLGLESGVGHSEYLALIGHQSSTRDAFLAVNFLPDRVLKLKLLEKLEMNSSEQEPMMESDEDEQMDNAQQNGIDEDLNSSQGKVSNCFFTFFGRSIF